MRKICRLWASGTGYVGNRTGEEGEVEEEEEEEGKKKKKKKKVSWRYPTNSNISSTCPSPLFFLFV